MSDSRRNFLKKTAAAVVAIPAIARFSPSLSYADDTKEVPADDPTAKALGYHADATTVDVAAFPKRAGPEGAKQFCSNCMLLGQGGMSLPGKDGVFGKCTVIQSGLINTKGWCNSWIQKPGM